MPVVEAWKSYTVSTKAAWGDSWTAQPHLICNQLQRSVMPTIDSASLSWRVGDLIQAGESTLAYVAPLDLVGQYVRIAISGLSVDWVGYIASEAQQHGADRDDGGDRVTAFQDQSFTAVGLEWFLSRAQVDSAVFYKTASTQDRIERAIGYNLGAGDGRSINYATRGNKDTRVSSGQHVFAQDPDHAELWNALQIVDSVLHWHGPRDNAGDPSPLPFATDIIEADAYLEWFTPSVRTEGRTVLDVLSEVLDRRRGLVWWLDYADADPQVTVRVSSSLSAAITLPSGEEIPAADSSSAYNFDQDQAVVQAVVNRDGSQKYDRIRVRGARRRSVMTVSISDGNLEENWKAEAETAYNAAEGTNADTNDRFRQANQFERVYRAFRIPADWDGRASDGNGGSLDYVSPSLAAGSVSILGGEPFNLHGLRCLRTMPLLAGYDYTTASSPVSNLPANTLPEFLQPFCLAKHDDKYVFLDRAANHIDEDESTSEKLKYSYAMRPLADEPGFEVIPGGGLPHALAKNHFDPDTDGASNITPELDYEDLIFTVCCEWDSHCEGFWPAAVPSAAPVQQLVIYVSDRYRLDWLAKHTVFDIDDDGTPKTVTTGGPLQDDRRPLEDLARLAFDWYQAPRATLDIGYANMQEPLALGTLITTIGTPGDTSEQTVNATVSQITHQPEVGTSSLTAGYAELDFGGLV